MSFMSGKPDLRARDAQQFVTEVADLLVRVHQIDVDTGSTSLRAAEPIDGWQRPETVPDGLLPPDLIGEVLSRATDLAAAAPPEEPVIAHGDLHPGNLLWVNGSVSALLDWSHVQIGTRAAELASFRIELAVLAGWPAAEMLIERYQESAGVPLEHQTLRDLLHVYAGHCWAHRWLEAWHEQERSDLTLADVSARLSEIARLLLAA